ncbi:hypothetical protein ACIBEF_32180 [Micromonospora sp. NPDC050795]|uniref:hypothetical protein n=1 Tax=Micromonospora sp. NPDC050795 TaxID=3364282 RepID=UPI003788B65C
MLSFGDLRLDEPRRRAWIHNKPSAVRLGWQEFLVLRALVEARGLPRSGEQIWREMPTTIRPARAGQIGVVIHRLRRRIGREYILTGDGGWSVKSNSRDGDSPDQVVVDDAAAIVLNRAVRDVWLDGQSQAIRLSPQEAAALEVILASRRTPLGGAQVFASMPIRLRPSSASVVSSIISRLRRKIGADRIVSTSNGWLLSDASFPGRRMVLAPHPHRSGTR